MAIYVVNSDNAVELISTLVKWIYLRLGRVIGMGALTQRLACRSQDCLRSIKSSDL